MKPLKDTDPILDHLIDIELSGDSDAISFYIRDHFGLFQKEYPFLHNSISVSYAIEKILNEVKSEALFLAVLEKIKDKAGKYFYRNISLLLSGFYLEANDAAGIRSVIDTYLIDEFKFHGYRHLLAYYATNYDEAKFLETFKKIEKRNTLSPYDKKAIALFIETYTDRVQDSEQTRNLVGKHKIWPKVEQYVVPMLVGLFKNRPYEDYRLVEEMVEADTGPADNRWFITESILNELYERTEDKEAKYLILNLLRQLTEKIPKELSVKGYTSKVWTLLLWRVGCKYIELNDPVQAMEIIKGLSGKNRESLKLLYSEKFT